MSFKKLKLVMLGIGDRDRDVREECRGVICVVEVSFVLSVGVLRGKVL